jgi:hypothetical protein
MDIKRSGTDPSAKGPSDWFTGTVRIDPLFSPPAPSQVSGALVTFDRVPAQHGTLTRLVRP